MGRNGKRKENEEIKKKTYNKDIVCISKRERKWEKEKKFEK